MQAIGSVDQRAIESQSQRAGDRMDRRLVGAWEALVAARVRDGNGGSEVPYR